MTRGIEELASCLESSPRELHSLRAEYRRRREQKPSGGFRTICEPHPELMRFQRGFLRRVLDKMVPHKCVHSSRGHSHLSLGAYHCRRAVLVRADVTNFFGSTTAARVGEWFSAQCWDEECVSLLLRLTTLDGALPQGAPTSSALADLVNIELDEKLLGLARTNRARYGRFVDDLVFSGDIHAPDLLLKEVGGCVREHGYRLNPLKCAVMRRGQRQHVVGLEVDRVAPSVARRRRREVRAAQHVRGGGGVPLIDGRIAYEAILAGHESYFAAVERKR